MFDTGVVDFFSFSLYIHCIFFRCVDSFSYIFNFRFLADVDVSVSYYDGESRWIHSSVSSISRVGQNRFRRCCSVVLHHDDHHENSLLAC